MTGRILVLLAAPLALGCAAATSAPGPATAVTAVQPPVNRGARAIRRDIPLTKSIRRAFAAGTRDSTGRPGKNYWQLGVDYKIDTRLDPATATVTGRSTATIRNNSDSALRSVVLRLDQNYFGPAVGRLGTPIEITDGMTVTRLVLNGRAMNVTDTATQPIPNSSRRQSALATLLRQSTSVHLGLSTPIQPGQTGTIETDWRFRVPNARNQRGDRMGRWGDTLFQVAQWYPRVAVFDDLRERGWDQERYLGPSEFYNNFGRFDVSIDVPAGWIVAATGVLQNPAAVLTPAARERLGRVLQSDSVRTIVSAAERGAGRSTAAGDRLVWRFVADSVNDFAWATSNQYVWDAMRAAIPGRTAIPVSIYYLPGNADRYAPVAGLVRHALAFYSRLLTPYIFPQFTVVDGPEGGMEYPMFIMSGAGAADHEVAHQWWPMMVGVNETRYGFMDEGFNEYVNILSDAARLNTPATLDGLGQSYGRISGDEDEPPLMWNANYGGPMYGFQTYQKAPLMLSSLGGVVGDEAVQKALSAYTKAWLLKHPSPWDFAFFMNNALGQDLGWFWYYWLFTTESVEGSIQSVSTSGSRTRVVVRQDGEMPSPVVLKVEFAASGPPIRQMSNSSPTDATTAIVTFPVDVWFDGSRTFTANLDFGGREITRITLDPGGRFPDSRPADNVWPRAGSSSGGR